MDRKIIFFDIDELYMYMERRYWIQQWRQYEC